MFSHLFLWNMIELAIEACHISHRVRNSMVDSSHYYWFRTINQDFMRWHLVMSKQLILGEYCSGITCQDRVRHLRLFRTLFEWQYSLVVFGLRALLSTHWFAILFFLFFSILVQEIIVAKKGTQTATRLETSIDGGMETASRLSMFVTKVRQLFIEMK